MQDTPVEDEAQAVTLEFRDPALEAAFMLDYARETRRFYQVALIVVLVLWSVSAGFDLLAPAAVQPQLLLVRFGLVAPVMVAAAVVGFLPFRHYQRLWQAAAIVVYLAVQLGIAGLVALAPGELSLLVVGGYLVTVLTGAALNLARAQYIIGGGAVGAVAMVVAMRSSAPFDARAMAIEGLWMGSALLTAALVSVRLEQGRRRRFLDRARLAREQDRTERLLANLLPASIAARLREGPTVIADELAEVSVLFADLKGFTQLSKAVSPDELVSRLDRVFTRFDQLAARHDLEKIKTIGDAYMVVGGAPFPRVDHAIVVTRMGLEMIEALRELEPTLELRVGIASGSVVAGVIGRSKHSYDLWGETVNFASRMESLGVPGRVQVSAGTRARLGAAFVVEDVRTIEGKGIGTVEAYLVVGRA